MTNIEKFTEVFGYVPEEFPCPVECPEEFMHRTCMSCPYYDFKNEEYNKPIIDEQTERDCEA